MKQKILNKITKKYIKVVAILVISFISLMSMTLKLNESNIHNNETIIVNILKDIPNLDINYLFIYIFIVYFYYKVYIKNIRIDKYICIISIFFSIILVLGESFSKSNSLDLLYKNIYTIIVGVVKFIGYYFIIYSITEKLFDKMYKITNIENKNKYLTFIFQKHPNISITIIILLLWLPFIIIFFPGILTIDATNQIAQLLGKAQPDLVNIINPDVTINNHHPVFSTLLIGLFLNIGKLINNVDIGIYMYVLLQLSMLIYAILYSFKIMRKLGTSNLIQLIVLGFYIFCPLISIYTFTIVKDVIFSVGMYIYILILLEIIIDKSVLNKKMFLTKIIFIIIFVSLMRNNGIYTVLLSFPVLIFYLKEFRKQLLVCFIIPVVIYIIINKIVYPAFQISPGSVREMLSIPFQQTARTLYEGKYYSQIDKSKINKVLDVDYISKKYNPILSDPVKDTFRKESTKKELLDYFLIWFKYLFKYPDIYIEATLNNCYGYLYPNKENIVGYFGFPKNFVKDNPINMKFFRIFQNARNKLQNFYNLQRKMPVIGTLLTPGFYNWMLLLLSLYNIRNKKIKKWLTVYCALISILLVCIASPYLAIRYMLTIVYSIPIMFIISVNDTKVGIKGEKL